MKLRRLRLCNTCSIVDVDIKVHDYTMMVGAHHADKRHVLADTEWTRPAAVLSAVARGCLLVRNDLQLSR